MTQRTARPALRAFCAAVLTAGALAAAPGVANAGIRPTEPVGQSDVARPGKVATAGSGKTSAQAVTVQATQTCRAAEGFSRVTAGALYRLVDSNPLGGANTMTEQRQVGTGWNGSTFAWTATGGDGVVYALTWAGDLKWYRYASSTTSWRSGSGAVIGRGFTPKTRIINIALGGDGRFYVVKANGALVVYRHTGRLTGAGTWANAGGWTIGTGWTGNEILVPNGDGTLYRQYQGALYWYRHSDPALGAVTWQPRRTIGSGWKFYDVLSAGGGVIYATEGGTGVVRQYRHTDPAGGANTWASSGGVVKMTARPDSFGIGIDPLACTST